MRAEEALAFFEQEPVSDILRLLALFEETERYLLLPLCPVGKETVLPRYGGEKRGSDIPAPPEREETADLWPMTVGEPAEPFYLTVFEKEGDSYFSWETVLPEEKILPVQVTDTKVTSIFYRELKTEEQKTFSTFQTLERGDPPTSDPARRELSAPMAPEADIRADQPRLPTVDELLDELERRLIRELQETEGIY